KRRRTCENQRGYRDDRERQPAIRGPHRRRREKPAFGVVCDGGHRRYDADCSTGAVATAVTSHTGPLCALARNSRNGSSGIGLAKKYPCAVSKPSSVRQRRSSAVSTPSPHAVAPN